MAIEDNSILMHIGGLHKKYLSNILNQNNTYDNLNGEIDLIQHSPYYYDGNIPSNDRSVNKLNILSLNCASINAKFDELNITIQQIHNNGTEIHAICLQETWLSENSDTSLLHIDDFNLIMQGKICSTHAGLLIYLCKNLKYKTLSICPQSTIWEGQFIEIIGNLIKKKLILGKIYRAPLDTIDNYKRFISELAPLLSYLDRRNTDVIIDGDFNIDLLKMNEKPIFIEYFHLLISHGFIPKNTLPTRLSEKSGTLIDNLLCKFTHNLYRISAGMLVSRISDHFPYFLQLDCGKIKRTLPLTYIRERNMNPTNLQNFKDEIANSNLLDSINSDTNASLNVKYNTFHDTITKALIKHLPIKQVKINKHKHKKPCWVTKGIIKLIKFRDNLYMKLKKISVD